MKSWFLNVNSWSGQYPLGKSRTPSPVTVFAIGGTTDTPLRTSDPREVIELNLTADAQLHHRVDDRATEAAPDTDGRRAQSSSSEGFARKPPAYVNLLTPA
jgi:hypothetical protein